MNKELLTTNSKTIRSFDTTTVCLAKRRGKPCAYCYVESSRNVGVYAKTVVDYEEYDGWVRRMRPEIKHRLNEVGGIRMFSFGDYMRTHKKSVQRFLDDCFDYELGAKAITKNVHFVKDFHDHPALNVIHVSIDNLPKGVGRSPITLSQARKLKQIYPKVRVRAVLLSEEDVEYFGTKKWIDILTPNHGNNGFYTFSHKEKEELAKRYPNRICCVEGTCEKCSVRCGLSS